MKRLLLVIVGAAVAAILAFLLTPSANGLGDKIGLSISLAFCIIQGGAVWLLLSSLRSFKTGLKVAYGLISAGALMQGLLQLLLPIVIIFHLSEVVALAIVALIFYVSSPILIYFGVRRFARLLSVRYLWTAPLFVFGLAIGSAILVSFLPFPEVGPPQTTAASAVFALAATVITTRIRGHLGPQYTPAMKWLTASLVVLALIGPHNIISQLFPSGNWYADYSLSLWPYLLFSLMFLKTGQLFRDSARETSAVEADANYLDAVIAIARLVSDPHSVEGILDKMRVITASKNATSQFSEANKATLIEVYMQLEHFLLTKDPLRKFTQSELRGYLAYDFQQTLLRMHPAAAN